MSELCPRLANGDPDAFAALYDQLADRLFPYIVAQTGSSTDAADILQEIFVRLYRGRSRLVDVDNIDAYVFRTARNEVIRWRARHASRFASAADLFEIPESLAPCQLEQREIAALALGELGEDEREVVELKIFSGLTFVEIASVIDRPAATVATWYRRALAKMRQSLSSEVDP